MESGEPLFSLAAVKGRGAVGRVAEEAAPDEMLASSDDDADAGAAAAGRDDEQEAASDDECVRRAVPSVNMRHPRSPRDHQQLSTQLLLPDAVGRRPAAAADL